MVKSEKGTVTLDGNITDIYVDIGVAVEAIAKVTVDNGISLDLTMRVMTKVLCESLERFLEKQTESMDSKAFDRLFDEAIKEWESSTE